MPDPEDEFEDIVEVRNRAGSTKRKVAINKELDTRDSSNEENKKGEQFLKPANASKLSLPLKSKGTYSGSSYANVRKKKAKLQKAAAVEVLKGSSSSEDFSSDSEEK
ncbi:hypothetical protein SERLA73DRAFT_79878 [Serpula lacrymans var. lacrymans S7.3]|uniref:Uncharacterized protein n=1 Tax=Serpula lacrymans var. lacrymans (strain S7.3) TaxID=936435 RepID=F8QHX0_SERL3|nr:hypothetical protein SERLA73DRAFT_79878 [Serpula lacrymans var. lacrymans S7.3]